MNMCEIYICWHYWPLHYGWSPKKTLILQSGQMKDCEESLVWYSTTITYIVIIFTKSSDFSEDDSDLIDWWLRLELSGRNPYGIKWTQHMYLQWVQLFCSTHFLSISRTNCHLWPSFLHRYQCIKKYLQIPASGWFKPVFGRMEQKLLVSLWG